MRFPPPFCRAAVARRGNCRRARARRLRRRRPERRPDGRGGGALHGRRGRAVSGLRPRRSHAAAGFTREEILKHGPAIRTALATAGARSPGRHARAGHVRRLRRQALRHQPQARPLRPAPGRLRRQVVLRRQLLLHLSISALEARRTGCPLRSFRRGHRCWVEACLLRPAAEVGHRGHGGDRAQSPGAAGLRHTRLRGGEARPRPSSGRRRDARTVIPVSHPAAAGIR